MRKLLPTVRQWKGWSLPSKHTAIGLLIGIISILLAIVFWILPRDTLIEPTREKVDISRIIVDIPTAPFLEHGRFQIQLDKAHYLVFSDERYNSYNDSAYITYQGKKYYAELYTSNYHPTFHAITIKNRFSHIAEQQSVFRITLNDGIKLFDEDDMNVTDPESVRIKLLPEYWRRELSLARQNDFVSFGPSMIVLNDTDTRELFCKKVDEHTCSLIYKRK